MRHPINAPLGHPAHCTYTANTHDPPLHHQVSDLVIHPGSSLSGFAGGLPRGQVLLYHELIETR